MGRWNCTSAATQKNFLPTENKTNTCDLQYTQCKISSAPKPKKSSHEVPNYCRHHSRLHSHRCHPSCCCRWPLSPPPVPSDWPLHLRKMRHALACGMPGRDALAPRSGACLQAAQTLHHLLHMTDIVRKTGKKDKEQYSQAFAHLVKPLSWSGVWTALWQVSERQHECKLHKETQQQHWKSIAMRENRNKKQLPQIKAYLFKVIDLGYVLGLSWFQLMDIPVKYTIHLWLKNCTFKPSLRDMATSHQTPTTVGPCTFGRRWVAGLGSAISAGPHPDWGNPHWQGGPVGRTGYTPSIPQPQNRKQTPGQYSCWGPWKPDEPFLRGTHIWGNAHM